MKVSLQLTRTHAAQARKLVLRDVDLDTALAISAALRDLQNPDVEAVIVVENLPVAPKRRIAPRARPASHGWAGWLRGLRLPAPLALAR